MYKVFVNEKKLSFGNSTSEAEKNLKYENLSTLEMAIDFLENTSCKEVHIFGENCDEIWEEFRNSMKMIEAAGGIVTNPKDEILFIYRLGKWDLPKGKIEPNESLESAAVREVEEETAITNLKLEYFINSTYHIYREKRQPNEPKILKKTNWFKMSYDGEITPVPQIEEGITKVEWKGKVNILHEVFPNTFNNIQLILTEHWDKN